MKKHHSSGGLRVVPRMMCYALVFLALVAARESWFRDGGPLTDSLGRGFNGLLMTGSKLGLGFAIMCEEKTGTESAVGRGGLRLGRASHKAFIDASKVEMYGN